MFIARTHFENVVVVARTHFENVVLVGICCGRCPYSF